MEKGNNNVIEISLLDFWKVFKRCWWVLVAVAILFSGAAYLYMDKTHSDRYEATATIYILRTDGRAQASDANLASAIIADCEQLIRSKDKVIKPAIKKLLGEDVAYSEKELDELATQVQRKLSVQTVGADSHLLCITVTSGTADGTALLANTLAQEASQYLNSKYGQSLADIVDTAKAPKSIANPISLFKIALVGLIAAFVVYLVWFIIFLFDDRIDSEEKVEKRLGLTILGSIPYQGGSARRKSRYGSAYGYYGYGSGAEQQKAHGILSSETGKKEDK